MFLKRLKNLLEIKTLQQTYLDYKHTIRSCVDIVALILLILCLMVKVWLISLAYFHRMILKGMIKLLLNYLKMTSINLELNEITKFRVNEINKVKEYFNAEIKERKDIVNEISKHIVAFHYADKIFITLSASFGTLSITSHATVVGIPVGIAGASLTLIFTVTTGIMKKLLSVTREKKKKHNKIIILAKNKLNIIETLMSQALIDYDISHEEFSRIIDKKIKYKGIKENMRNLKIDPDHDLEK